MLTGRRLPQHVAELVSPLWTDRERERERERAAPQQTCVKADKRTTEVSVLLLQNKGSTLNERHLQALCEGFYTSPRFDFS